MTKGELINQIKHLPDTAIITLCVDKDRYPELEKDQFIITGDIGIETEQIEGDLYYITISDCSK